MLFNRFIGLGLTVCSLVLEKNVHFLLRTKEPFSVPAFESVLPRERSMHGLHLYFQLCWYKAETQKSKLRSCIGTFPLGEHMLTVQSTQLQTARALLLHIYPDLSIFSLRRFCSQRSAKCNNCLQTLYQTFPSSNVTVPHSVCCFSYCSLMFPKWWNTLEPVILGFELIPHSVKDQLAKKKKCLTLQRKKGVLES